LHKIKIETERKRSPESLRFGIEVKIKIEVKIEVKIEIEIKGCSPWLNNSTTQQINNSTTKHYL